MKNKAEISIIIPFKDAQRTLDFCLKSILRLDYQFFELILVDNNSSDSSRKIAENFAAVHGKKFRIQIVDETRPGASAARNRGVSASNGNFIAFTDADCVVDELWLSDSIIGFDGKAIGAVAGNIIGYKTRGAVDAFHSVFTFQCWSDPQVFDCFTIISGGFPTANLMVRRDVFDLIGGFDEGINIYGEDYDLCARIYTQAYKVKYIPSATVYHINRHELIKTWKQAFGFGFSHALLWKRHGKDFQLSIVGKWAIRSKHLPLRGWIDLSTADKKLLYLLTAAVMFWPAILLLPLYFIYLTTDIAARCRKKKITVTISKLFAMAGLLVIKSAAMTAGRIVGGVKYRVICF